MRLTTKGRFAVTAMIDLAMGSIAARSLSRRSASARISRSPTSNQLFGKLRRHELVDSVRGPGGGYSLARLRAQCHGSRHSFSRSTNPWTPPAVAASAIAPAATTASRQVHDPELWTTLNRKMVDYLDSVSLQDLVDQQRVRQLQEAANQAQGCSAVRVNRSTPVAANATA
ncbi:Rrf2 family transcriptional regulator [Bordetella pertussis]|uniref:Rrf2 family transcriptional regulator n=1 Tax=Bordetella pertussis TaxID=520 RepID=UPI0028E4FC84|nr:Rrf2 family transcriptional regulator [Bordetella pertussis]WNR27541.1 Rrf2 family transcriptional regulator [Bordetella pertussis]